jgi:NAD(P)-dependent dehydrogenase (short-subunit alcohol dehydrogenase family)
MIMFDFANQIVLITGASGALGSVVARQFQDAGARLVLIGGRGDTTQQIFADLVLDPQHLVSGSIDVTNPSSVEPFIHQVLEQFGRIDILINTVGGYRAGTPVHETPVEEWDFMMNLNARSVFVTCCAVVPAMLKQGEGKIVSVAGRAGLSAFAGAAGYCASKSAVIRLTETLSAELKEHGINVNCVLPSTIDTRANRADRPSSDFSKWVAPEALGDVIMFLCSSAARAIHGAAIPVYGLS